MYIFSQEFFPELQSYNISTWMSNKHCKVHKSKTEPPKSPLKLALPGVFLLWLMAAPFFHCSGPNLAVIPTPPPLTAHVHLISKSCWIYIQRISRIQPFLTIFTATTLVHITSISLLGYGTGLPAGLSASALAPQSVLQSSQSNQIRSQIKPSVGRISLGGKTMSLWQAATPASSGSPSVPWPPFLLSFPSLLLTPHSSLQVLPKTRQAHSYLRAFTPAVASEWNVCRASSLISFRSLLKSLSHQ